MRIDPVADRALIAALSAGGPRPRGAANRTRSPSIQLLDAVMRLAGPHAELLRHAERPWASATFQGTRHTIALCFTGPESVAAGEAFIDAVPEHEFTISRQIVADASVNAVEQIMQPLLPHMTVEVEMLLLEDC